MTNESYFDFIAQAYDPLSRYSKRCLARVVDLLSVFVVGPKPAILDLGCGNGYPAAVLAQRYPLARFCLVDRSPEMIRIARQSWKNPSVTPEFTVADALCLPFRPQEFDLALASCMVHLVQPQSALFEEVKRVLKPNGVFSIMTYDPNDIGSQLFHKYFPKYMDFDLIRHRHVIDICADLTSLGLHVLCVQKFRYRTRFRTREQLLQFVSSRPFSTFACYSNDEFESANDKFRENIERALPTEGIVNTCVQTCIISSLSKRHRRSP